VFLNGVKLNDFTSNKQLDLSYFFLFLNITPRHAYLCKPSSGKWEVEDDAPPWPLSAFWIFFISFHDQMQGSTRLDLMRSLHFFRWHNKVVPLHTVSKFTIPQVSPNRRSCSFQLHWIELNWIYDFLIINSYLSPQFKYMIFYISICILHLLRVYFELTMWPAPRWSTAPVSQRSWIRIPFRPEFLLGFNFTTAQVVCITAMINHKFISFSAVQLYDL